MLIDEALRPYREATIKLLDVPPSDLNLTTLYALKANIETQRHLRTSLLEFGYDSLNLGGLLRYEWDDGKEYSLMPPVVEVVERYCKILPRPWEISYETAFPIKFPVLLDGFHRAYLARELWLPLQVLFIDHIDPTCPSYAHPNSWEEVKLCDSVPTDPKDKKHYISENPKTYYKNFWVLVHSHYREGAK